MNTDTDKNFKEPSFNHFTVNTGHSMVQTKQYFRNTSVINAKLRELAQESLKPEGVEVISNVRFCAKEWDDAYRGTVCTVVDGMEAPLLTTFGVKTEEAGKRIWREIQNMSSNFGLDKKMNHRPRAPFVADLLYGFIPNSQTFEFFSSGMSGSFCKYMGWAFLFPEVISEDEAISRCDFENDLSNQWRDFVKEFSFDMEAEADRAEMMDEAVKRMEMLGLPKDTINEFKNSGRSRFGMENGRRFPLSDSEKEQIQKLEKNGKNLVYAVIRNDSRYGKMVNYIMVSRYKCDWELERRSIMDRNHVIAHVHNRDCPGWSETGIIEVKRLPEGMLDRKML